MPSVTRKPQANREERRERIERALLDATDRLMSDGTSFTELSVDRLATEAGISRASFYIYFEDKGHLLRRLAAQVFDDLAHEAQQWWGVAGRRNPGDVHTAMSGIIASYRRHQPVLVALNEMSAYDPLVAQTYRDLLTGISAQLARVIEEGQADGSIRAQLPAETTASTLTWMVERTCHQNLPSRPASYDAELADTLTEIVWGALYLRPASTDR
ncbi:TetR/AcrR family transcriptional regulator [Mycolicibacterium smegmatis]|jgi:AcrR family transcriptional regulator|uniref:Transcriptional regulator, TetR family protein n=1 Tax=Mycolicibacterium smegmatis (strain MKD8) TaxID=1214915 RepID=A0A2U9PW23_MYCSE|nr:TetR/AcrR family transcriptional regulator [Mycolicibacterium smegmatis]AWT55465.1 transcriptional regulator, TetR family protein [Mycolicibacterium smegmatis MKD8]MCP2628224.1 TetR/AcrR family transcriptional regulator [Mycolicibacterium smegmatis]MDF1897403.1 TetR/AcrR family transcriptional regulator [Mycolicibacterium smegmatis]MDF1904154.1 TetR/AcrR family transcriptional regulator [Mycolicibacterium smegmatis]MDF1916969.1 TetR/AcrR family transcriptional regulator [Mycolicibacterium s